MREIEKKESNLEKRVIEIETKLNLLKDILAGLPDSIKLSYGNFAMYAFLYGFTSDELEKLNELMSFSVRNSDKFNRDEFVKEFNIRLPKFKDHLEVIMREYIKDGYALKVCKEVLGEETDDTPLPENN